METIKYLRNLPYTTNGKKLRSFSILELFITANNQELGKGSTHLQPKLVEKFINLFLYIFLFSFLGSRQN